MTQTVLFAWGRLSPTRSNSRAKLFSELDKISYKPGLHFLSRPNKCFLFLIFVMASGPVDCYWSALRGRPLISAACSVLPTSTVQRSWDPLKTTIFSLFICCWGFESLQFIFQTLTKAQSLLVKNRIKAKTGIKGGISRIKGNFSGLIERSQVLAVLLSPSFFTRKPKVSVMRGCYKAHSFLQTFMKTKYNSRN